MLHLPLISFLALAGDSLAAPEPVKTLPLVINQGPTRRCFDWLAEGDPHPGAPPERETHCAAGDSYGRFQLMTNGWGIKDYKKSPGYDASVIGSDGSPLTVSLANNAKGASCDIGPEVNMGYNYWDMLDPRTKTEDLYEYDEIIIEYDIIIKTATAQKDCSCLKGDGSQGCVEWWKTQFFLDLLFYQGNKPKQDFLVLSIRVFDPQNSPDNHWSTGGDDFGYRWQYTDNKVNTKEGARGHVRIDAKHLIMSSNAELCQESTAGPLHFRSIQLVSKSTGGDLTVEISNFKANAFKYPTGTFTPPSAKAPGCTPKNCPVQPQDPAKSCKPGAAALLGAAPAPPKPEATKMPTLAKRRNRKAIRGPAGSDILVSATG